MVLETKEYLDRNEKNRMAFLKGEAFAEQKILDFYEAARECEDISISEQVRLQIEVSLEVIEHDIPIGSREEQTPTTYFDGVKFVFKRFLEEN